MANQPPILQPLQELGSFLTGFCDPTETKEGLWHTKLEDAIRIAQHKNSWFTRENVLFALHQWGNLLTKSNLENWMASYQIPVNGAPKTIAVIMAGNIPLVGLHDFLSVLVTGNKVLAKLSSNDEVLLPLIAEFLMEREPALRGQMAFTQEKLTGFDAVIATGSNNTGRYFEHYFGKYPSIIRKNRNSVAVLTGNETKAQLRALGIDIFTYFGLGCRSVSKIFVPKDYGFDVFFESIYGFKDIINNHKYANNYDYNKAVYLMSEYKILDNNFLLLKEDTQYGSPIGTLFYEFYDTITQLQERFREDRNQLQCIVANGCMGNCMDFGQTQRPNLGDYADDVDTVSFLLNLQAQRG